MKKLNTEPNIADPDAVYQCFIDMHAGRSPGDSHRLNAKLILTLANHIGDADIIREAISVTLETETSIG